jgi:hypothetical protein
MELRRALLLVLLPLATAAAPLSPAGEYRLVGETDVASAFLLKPDGHFQYFLSAGSLDQQAQGRWTSDGKSVFFTTEPKPVPPLFKAGTEARTDEEKLTIRVVTEGGRGLAGVDLRIGFASGDPTDSYTQEVGWSLPPEETRTPLWVELSLPSYGMEPNRFPIEVAKANALAFTLVANDFGVIDFEALPADLTPNTLTTHRGGGAQKYERVRD